MAAQTELQILVNVKDEASKAFDKIGGNLKGLGVAMAAVGGGIVAGLGAAVKAAEESEVSQKRFETVLKNVSGATDDQIAALRRQQDALQQTTRFEGDAIASAQGFLGTFQLTAAQIQQLTPELLNMGEGLRKATGGTIDLEGASNLLGKAISMGSVAGLQRVGITIPGVTQAQKDLFEKTFALANQQERVAMVSELVNSNFKGLAESAGTALAGRMDQLKNKFGDVMKTIGNQLIPVLVDLLSKLMSVIDAAMKWIGENPKLTQTIIMIAAVLGPLLIILPSLVAAIMAILSPIGLFILIIAALVAAGVALYMNWDLVKAKATEIWNGIAEILTGIVNRIKSTIVGMINYVIDKVNSAINFFNSAIALLNKVPGVSVPSIPNIPKLAQGGIVRQPTIAMIGEAGPEAVVPLRGAGAGGAGSTINISIGNFFGGDPQAAARELGDLIIGRLQLNARVG